MPPNGYASLDVPVPVDPERRYHTIRTKLTELSFECRELHRATNRRITYKVCLNEAPLGYFAQRPPENRPRKRHGRNKFPGNALPNAGARKLQLV